MAPTCKEQVPQYAKYIINCIDAAWKDGSATVSIKGGTFGHDYSHSPEGEGTSYLAPGYAPTANADGTYGVVAGVAQIGSKAYASLADAVAAAQDGETVTLLTDVTEDVAISRSITLDLGGKTLTNTNAGKATISVQGGTVTVKVQAKMRMVRQFPANSPARSAIRTPQARPTRRSQTIGRTCTPTCMWTIRMPPLCNRTRSGQVLL